MPELPEVELYLHALRPRITGQPLDDIRLVSPSLLRTVEPPLRTAVGRTVVGLRRIGKRIVWELEEELFLIFHLMIAGRFRWKDRGAAVPRKLGHAAFDFPDGTLLLTEAGSKKRAALFVVQGTAALAAHDPGGIEPLDIDFTAFAAALRRHRHTLKRALSDPRILSGIGNAYSDEILHRAKLSPFRRTDQIEDAELHTLFDATRAVLTDAAALLRRETGDAFPEKVTAFHPSHAVHGRYGQPCPVCGSLVQRVKYADNEMNYCATCQLGGRVLADRGLSRLLGEDWPRTLEELEALRNR